MWRSSRGLRTLKGAEARLFRESLSRLCFDIQFGEADRSQRGVTIFGALTRDQKIVVLAQVAVALLRDEQPAPPVTAILEGAVAATFETTKNLIAYEIDETFLGDDPSNFRRLVTEVARAVEGCDCPPLSSTEKEDWDRVVDEIATLILQAPDEESRAIGLGTPPKVDSAAVAAAIKSLKALASQDESGEDDWQRWTCPGCGRSWMVKGEVELSEEIWRCSACSPPPGRFRAGDLVRVRGPEDRKHCGVIDEATTAPTMASVMPSTSLIRSLPGPFTGEWRVFLAPPKLAASSGWPDIGLEGEIEILNALPLDRARRVRLCAKLMRAHIVKAKRIRLFRRSERARLFPDLYR